jgi:hypothetical protein
MPSSYSKTKIEPSCFFKKKPTFTTYDIYYTYVIYLWPLEWGREENVPSSRPTFKRNIPTPDSRRDEPLSTLSITHFHCACHLKPTPFQFLLFCGWWLLTRQEDCGWFRHPTQTTYYSIHIYIYNMHVHISKRKPLTTLVKPARNAIPV